MKLLVSHRGRGAEIRRRTSFEDSAIDQIVFVWAKRLKAESSGGYAHQIGFIDRTVDCLAVCYKQPCLVALGANSEAPQYQSPIA